jgi:hypothetical protein
MWEHPSLKMGLAIVAIAFIGVALLIVIIRYNGGSWIWDNSDALLGIGGIVFGLIVAFFQTIQGRRIESQNGHMMELTHRVSEQGEGIEEQSKEIRDVIYQVNEQGNRMEKILGEMKRIDEEVRIMQNSIKVREDRRKNYYLHRIISTTERIRDEVVTLQRRVNEYRNERRPETWQIITKSSESSIAQIKADAQGVVQDFSRIVDLVEDPNLHDKFHETNVFFSVFVFERARTIDAAGDLRWNHGMELLDLTEEMDRQIRELDDTLSRLKEEKPPTRVSPAGQ